MDVTLPWTLGIMAAAALVAGLANWRSRRPYVPGRPPLVPPGAVQFVALVVFFVMAAHLVSLLTGTPLEPRRGFR